MTQPSILIVDDDEANLVVLEEFLLDEYDVATAGSGLEALDILEEKEFDVIISDQRMPLMTGVEMLAKARRRYPDTVRMVLTAYSDAEAMLRAINEGNVYRFLLKPWDRVEMAAAIRQALDHRENVLAIKRLVQELSGKNRELERSLADLREARDKLLHTTKLATVGQITSSMVHELKQQLSSVAVLHDVVAELELPAETNEFVNHGLDAIQTIFHMVADMHAFARNDRWRLKRVWADVNEVADEAVRFTLVDRTVRDCEVVTDFGDVPRCFVDRDKLKQIVINLVRNAAQAAGDGGLITVRTRAADGEVTLSISDDGPGVPQELRTRIWEPFYTTKSEAGLGLGLEITRKLVEAHDGHIRLEPPGERGATFSVVLPVEPPAMVE